MRKWITGSVINETDFFLCVRVRSNWGIYYGFPQDDTKHYIAFYTTYKSTARSFQSNDAIFITALSLCHDQNSITWSHALPSKFIFDKTTTLGLSWSGRKQRRFQLILLQEESGMSYDRLVGMSSADDVCNIMQQRHLESCVKLLSGFAELGTICLET